MKATAKDLRFHYILRLRPFETALLQMFSGHKTDSVLENSQRADRHRLLFLKIFYWYSCNLPLIFKPFCHLQDNGGF